MHFGCDELVEQHSSTRSTRRARLARHVVVVSRRDETNQVEFWLKTHDFDDHSPQRLSRLERQRVKDVEPILLQQFEGNG